MRKMMQERASAAVTLPAQLRQRARDAIIDKAERLDLEIVCLVVAATHVHLLARVSWEEHRDIVGKLKRHSSHALRDVLPGRIWGKRCSAKRIRDRAHQVITYRYILKHGRTEGASVWTARKEG